MEKDKNLNHDLQTTPIKIRTNTHMAGYGGKIRLILRYVDTIQIDIPNSEYYTYSCNFHGMWTNFKNLPNTPNKEWTIIKTKEALTILCDEEEVVNLVYAEVHDYCSRKWSKALTQIYFSRHDTASEVWQPLKKGSHLILKLVSCTDVTKINSKANINLTLMA